ERRPFAEAPRLEALARRLAHELARLLEWHAEVSQARSDQADRALRSLHVGVSELDAQHLRHAPDAGAQPAVIAAVGHDQRRRDGDRAVRVLLDGVQLGLDRADIAVGIAHVPPDTVRHRDLHVGAGRALAVLPGIPAGAAFGDMRVG